MGASVPESRLDLTQDGVRISNSIRSATWIDAARQQCWLAGRGHMPVPAHAPMVSITAASTANFAWRTAPRYVDTRYCYGVLLSAETPVAASVTVDGVSYSVGVLPRNEAQALAFFEERSAKSAAEATLGMSIQAVGGTIDVEALSVEALPRAILATDANELGADRLAFWPRSPIANPNIYTQALGRQSSLLASARRTGGFQFAFGDLTPWSMASGTWTAVFDADVALLGRYLYSGDTTRTFSWRVLAYCSDGTTAGSVRISNVSGGTAVSTITIPAGTTAATWLPSTAGAAATFTADCEDPTAADGRRSTRWDDHTIEVQRTAGTGTIYVETISIWEA